MKWGNLREDFQKLLTDNSSHLGDIWLIPYLMTFKNPMDNFPLIVRP